MTTNFLALEDIIWIHDEIVIKQFGGSHGMLSFNALESVVSTPQQTMFGEDLYPDLSSKAAILFYLLVKNHCFLDGNKRTAVLSLIEFLERNAFTLVATQDEVVGLAINVATTMLDKDAVTDWLRAHWRPLTS